MNRTLLATWMVLITCLCATSAMASNAEDLDAKIAALEAKIAELEARQRAHWLDDRRAEQIKELVRDVLADADSRASLLEGGLTAGHDGRFFIASADGAFRLSLRGQLQVRYVATFRNNSGDDDFEGGFTLRRAKLGFEGYVGEPRVAFRIVLASDRDSGDVYLEQATIGHEFDRGIRVSIGRFKPRVLREEFTGADMQLAADRSVMNELFTWGYSEGIELAYERQERFRLYMTVIDGPAAGEDTATKDFQNDNSDVAFTVRTDVKVMGNWEQMQDFTGLSGREMAIFIGAAVAYNIAETGDVGGSPNDNLLTWTVDASIEVEGFSAFIAFIGNHEFNADTPDVNEYALVVQGGYRFFNDQIEPFLRWEHLFADTNSRTMWTDDLDIITAGFNYYVNGQKTKLTADVLWALDTVPAGISGLGLLSDAPGEKNQVVLRLQLQLLF